MHSRILILAAACIALLPATSRAVPVDLELLLAADVTNSIDADEFDLQRQGYADAFRSTAVIDAILGGTHGAIAVSLVYWVDETLIEQTLGWQLVDSVESAEALASLIETTPRPFSSSPTRPGDALDFIVGSGPLSSGDLFEDSGFESDRQVIDISSDGPISRPDSLSMATAAQRDNALASGVDAINAILIHPEAVGDLVGWYNDNVIGGDDAFLVTALSFDDFGDAVATKIETEITTPPMPEPSSVALMLLGLSGLGYVRRRRRS